MANLQVSVPINQFKRTVLASAVALVCSFAYTHTVEAANSSENDESNSERIEVTGSRLKQIDIEGASPITVLTADDLEKSGFVSVAEALRSSALNSFGSWGGGANNSWGSQSAIDLKGIGADRTLVLLNGRRMIKSPVMDNGAANLNMIPVAAVERVEILTDGASAIYGTDAISGVINIILRKDYEGITVEGGKSSPTREGGDSSSFSISAGSVGDKSSSLIVFEHDEFSSLYQRDREYAKNRRNDSESESVIQGWTGLSANSRNITRASDGSYDVLPMVQSATGVNSGDRCSVYNINGETGFFPVVLGDADWPADRLCGYNYTNQAAMSSGVVRDNLLVNMLKDLNEDWSLTLQTYYGRTRAKDISAPSTANWTFEADLPSYTTAQGITLTPVFAGDEAAYRLNGNGNRVAEHNDSLLNILLGLKGSTGALDWDFSLQHNRYNRFVWGTGYALLSNIIKNIGHWDTATNSFIGWDPRDPYSQIPNGIRANFDKKDEGVLNEVTAGFSTDLMTLSNGALSMYVGASHQQEDYLSTVDGLADAKLIAGGNGGSGGVADRTASAVYTEFGIPLMAGLDAIVALRHDKYSDFGSSTNPKLSLTYRLNESNLFRTSWGTGFRAPSLPELNRQGQQSFDNVVDWVGCAGTNGGDISACRGRTVENLVTANPELDAETSSSWNLGYVFDAGAWHVTVDYWGTKIEDTIVELSGSNIMYRQYLLDLAASPSGTFQAGAGQDISEVLIGADIIRTTSSPTSRLRQIKRPSVNAGQLESRGLILGAHYRLETSIGDFDFDGNFSRTYSRVETLSNGAGLSSNYIGTIDWPRERFDLSASYSVGDHRITISDSEIASQTDYSRDSNGDLQVIDTVPHSKLLNLTYRWIMPIGTELTLGVRNLEDVDPAFQRDAASYNGSLYYSYQFGRTYFANMKVEFK